MALNIDYAGSSLSQFITSPIKVPLSRRLLCCYHCHTADRSGMRLGCIYETGDR